METSNTYGVGWGDCILPCIVQVISSHLMCLSQGKKLVVGKQLAVQQKGLMDGWMNQAYSLLSTTHGHITDCKLLVCMYWTRFVLV